MTETAPLDPSFVADFAHRWLGAWNARDGDAVAALCTDDVLFFDPGLGEVVGRPAVSAWVAACARAFPDYVFDEPEPPCLSPDRPKAIAPWRMRGTFTGSIEPPGFSPTGRTFELEGVDHWWFRDGLVERYRADYDSLGLLRQLGLMPARGSEAEKGLAAAQRAAAWAMTQLKR